MHSLFSSSLSSSGHNQRMEFLGDSIMQLVATEYLFIHFPDHHEGHLTVRSNRKSSLHLCFVFLPLLPASYPTWSYSCAFVFVCVWVIFTPSLLPFHPSHQSLNLRVPARYSPPSPPSSSACFHKITLFLCSPNTAAACLLYSVWWVLSWDRIVQRFFNNTSLSAHFLFFFWRGLSSAWKKIEIKLRVCAQNPGTACNTGTKQMIGAFENAWVHFLTASDGITAPPLFSVRCQHFFRRRRRLTAHGRKGLNSVWKKLQKEPFAVWYLFVDVLYRWKPWRHLFKSFQPAFRWETESSSNVYAQESRWGTFEMDFISGQKKCSFNQCVSACVCVCTVKEGTSQRDRFRQSYCILFALFRISQLYLTCFFFPFTDVNVPRPV